MHFLLIWNILKSKIFILWVCCMEKPNQSLTNHKRVFVVFLIAFMALVGWRGYLKFSGIVLAKTNISIQNEIKQEKSNLAHFSDELGFDKLQYIQDLESNNKMMPWSDHIAKIMAIFSELLAVDNSDTFNISFTDFQISLESIRLRGYVTSLRLLYRWAGSATIQESAKPALIEKFEALDFLDNIAIKTYEKSSDDFGYEFVLTANVINNAK